MTEIAYKKNRKDSFSSYMVKALKPTTTLSSKSNQVHLLGRKKVTQSVARELEQIGFAPVCFETVKNLRAHTTGQEGAVIYCSPLKRSEIMSVHQNLVKFAKFKHMNFMAIVPEWLNTSTERMFYRKGIPVIFEWPREKATFTRLFSDLIKQEDQSTRCDDTDRALKKAISNRLLARNKKIEPGLEVSVYNGIAIARGNLNSIGEKKELVRFIRNIPGVRGVVDQSLYVGNEKLPGLVKKKAREVLKESEAIPDRTLDVKVSPDEKTLVLVGSTASTKTAEKVVERLEKFKGVEEVKDRVNVSPHRHSRDLVLAKTGQRILKKINLGSPDRVFMKVINGNAILRGSTSSAILLHQMENAIRNMDGIASVTNQIRVDHSVPVNFY